MRLHTERLTCEKKEDTTSMPIALTKTEIQSEEEDMYDKRQLPWSSDDGKKKIIIAIFFLYVHYFFFLC